MADELGKTTEPTAKELETLETLKAEQAAHQRRRHRWRVIRSRKAAGESKKPFWERA